MPSSSPTRTRAATRALADVAPDVAWLEPFPSAESAFRNKAKLVVGGVTGAVTVGILDADANGVDLRACGLHEPPLQRPHPPAGATSSTRSASSRTT